MRVMDARTDHLRLIVVVPDDLKPLPTDGFETLSYSKTVAHR